MLSARAGEEGTIEGLEAGADDYLVKPFAARELLARVRANLELERVRRTRDQLQTSRTLLDQAQRLARVGSWEIDLRHGRDPRLRRVRPAGRHRGRRAAHARAGRRLRPHRPSRRPGPGAGRAHRRDPGRRPHRLRGPGAGAAAAGVPHARERRARRGRAPGPHPRLQPGHHGAARRRGGAGGGRRGARGRGARAPDRATSCSAASSPRPASGPRSSRSRPTTSPGSRARRSAATGTT